MIERAPFAEVAVHVVTGPRPGGWPAERDAALAAISAGARIVQLRDKTSSARELAEKAHELVTICRKRGAYVLVNDRLDVALAAGADGAHLGESDLPWREARRIAPRPFLLGFSAATAESAREALAAGADYVGAGPAYVTGSKLDAGDPLPTARFGELRALLRGTPLVAIGGIACGGAAPLVRAGADAVAVISAVMGADDPGEAARRLVAEVLAARAERAALAAKRHPHKRG